MKKLLGILLLAFITTVGFSGALVAAPPNDNNTQGTNMNNQGTNYNNRGQNMNNRGQNYNNRGQNMNNRGQNYNNRGQNFNNRGPNFNNRIRYHHWVVVWQGPWRVYRNSIWAIISHGRTFFRWHGNIYRVTTTWRFGQRWATVWMWR